MALDSVHGNGRSCSWWAVTAVIYVPAATDVAQEKEVPNREPAGTGEVRQHDRGMESR